MGATFCGDDLVRAHARAASILDAGADFVSEGPAHEVVQDGDATDYWEGDSDARANSSEAQANVLASISAVETFAAEQPGRGYEGMTLEELRNLDPSVNVEIGWATIDSYCVESSVGGQSASYSIAESPLSASVVSQSC